jgi:hypothetical protein
MMKKEDEYLFNNTYFIEKLNEIDMKLKKGENIDDVEINP